MNLSPRNLQVDFVDDLLFLDRSRQAATTQQWFACHDFHTPYEATIVVCRPSIVLFVYNPSIFLGLCKNIFSALPRRPSCGTPNQVAYPSETGLELVRTETFSHPRNGSLNCPSTHLCYTRLSQVLLACLSACPSCSGAREHILAPGASGWQPLRRLRERCNG